MSNKKGLFYVFSLSFLILPFCIPQTSGMESKSAENNVKFPKTARFVSLDDYILQDQDIDESKFIRIMISVCDNIIVKQKCEDLCSYVSGQSIKICDSNDNITVAIDEPFKSKSCRNVTSFTAVFWIIKMLNHYLGVEQFPNSVNKKFRQSNETFGIFKKFKNIRDLLYRISIRDRVPVWHFPHHPSLMEKVSIHSLYISFQDLLGPDLLVPLEDD